MDKYTLRKMLLKILNRKDEDIIEDNRKRALYWFDKNVMNDNLNKEI